MRIGILGTAWPYRGGLAAFNERLARQFVSEGDEVEVLTFTMQYPDFLFPGKTQYSDSPKPADLSICRTMNSIDPASWVRTANRIAALKLDLLVVKFWTPQMAPCLGSIARFARKQGVKVVSVLDNVIPHEKHFYDATLVRYFINSVDGFVAMSESVRQDCLKFLPSERHSCVLLSPHPLYDNFGASVNRDEACRMLDLPADKTLLLFFGFIRDYKGLDLLLKAYAKALVGHPDLRLVVAGEFYNNAQQYKDLEQALGLAGKVIWRSDFIPDDTVRIYFSASDLVVQPYKSATQSGVTQIAYHFEKPMLVTDVGGLAEIVPDGRVGYVCRVDEDDIAAAIGRFAGMDTAQREAAFAGNIKAEKRKYAWSTMTDAIRQTIK